MSWTAWFGRRNRWLRFAAALLLASRGYAGLAQDPKKLREDSPRLHAAGVNIPVLLVHGARDYTVEVDHTKMMDAALKRAGKPHETLIIPKTDHYFREDDARRALYTALLRFLGEQLGTPATAGAQSPGQ